MSVPASTFASLTARHTTGKDERDELNRSEEAQHPNWIYLRSVACQYKTQELSAKTSKALYFVQNFSGTLKAYEMAPPP
jgi:hypothetical protein